MIIRRSSLPATASAFVVALLVALSGLVVAAPRAEASSTLLCQGFTGCARAGYSSFGYSAVYRQMWWRMYGGHNCTNYVAYRMVSRGMSSTRPWSGSGDARNWGVVFASRTDQTPKVGSVAWWSSNHVAYVQQVIDANTIVVSEDHWGGDFDWRRIVRSGGGWPTGFIHLNDERIAATATPAISGTAKVDSRLAASPGTWNVSGVSYAYQWLANGAAIAGATASTYTPTAQQVGVRLSVRVKAKRYGYTTGKSYSVATPATAPGTMRPTAAPVVTGLAKVGGVLTVTGGSFTPAASSSAISWLADGLPVAGATGSTLTLGADQLGKRVTAVVTGRRAGYTNAATSSAPTLPVGPEKLTITREPVLTGTPRVGRPLTVTPGVVGPDGVLTAYRWLRDGTPIRRAKSPQYVPSVADLGTRLSLRVTYTKPGYSPVRRVLALPERVQSRALIRAASHSHHTVTVRLRAEGVDVVRGQVTLVDAQGHERTRRLRHGEATFRSSWLRKGSRTLTIVYRGSARVEDRSTIRTIAVR